MVFLLKDQVFQNSGPANINKKTGETNEEQKVSTVFTVYIYPDCILLYWFIAVVKIMLIQQIPVNNSANCRIQAVNDSMLRVKAQSHAQQ